MMQATPVVGRYAPSPTGALHYGNLRTALVAWLAARLSGGTFLMRVEDIDKPRVVPGCEGEQLRDLVWLGIDWDGPIIRQSERGETYRELFAQTEREGRTYWCTCSRKDLAAVASAPHGEDGPPYPGTCRHKAADVQRAHPQGASARLVVEDREEFLDDAILGELRANLSRESGDFVILRRDGLWAYHWACAVDDALMGVTQVVRGADLAAAAFKQRYIHRCLKLESPQEWWHLPLMHGAAGRRLAKRDGSDGVAALRSAGEKPDRVVGQLAASLGLVPAGTAISAGELRIVVSRPQLLAALRR